MSNFEEDNISRLKFIGKIKKGEKINVKDMAVQPNNVYTKIHRSLMIVDNRNNTLGFIMETIKKSFDELLTHLDKSKDNLFDLNIASNMVQDLENSKAGLNNLKDTYFDDLMFCCKIDTIVQDIDARLEQIKSNYAFVKSKPKPIDIPTKNNSTINASTTNIYTQKSPHHSPHHTPNNSPHNSPHHSPQQETSYHDLLPSSLSSVDSITGSLSSGLTKNKNKR